MFKAIVTAIAMTVATSAYATDLPSRKPAPAPVASEAVPLNSVGFSVGPEYAADSYKKPTLMMYNLGYDRNVGGGASVGFAFGTTQGYPNGDLNQTIEGKVGYSKAIFDSVTARFGAGIGERFTNGANYTFYALRTGVDYKVTDNLTWNTIGYQFRSTFDSAYHGDYQNHDLRTGVSYSFAKNHSVSTSFYRSFDKDRNKVADGVLFGYSMKY